MIEALSQLMEMLFKKKKERIVPEEVTPQVPIPQWVIDEIERTAEGISRQIQKNTDVLVISSKNISFNGVPLKKIEGKWVSEQKTTTDYLSLPKSVQNEILAAVKSNTVLVTTVADSGSSYSLQVTGNKKAFVNGVEIVNIPGL